MENGRIELQYAEKKNHEQSGNHRDERPNEHRKISDRSDIMNEIPDQKRCNRKSQQVPTRRSDEMKKTSTAIREDRQSDRSGSQVCDLTRRTIS